ncbi:bifunctional RNA recognition motif domain/Class II Aminoacyl-tRNA synthetase-Biotinyl protein ligase (BPL) and lipoyl protein ligase (LPL)/Nucleotide-binding alpha-beta plait domain superfamily/RNA-binding domain superfamily [Babesia duncani]|uniref:RRM domain-containing protein n=1 Tax=Babesia duncani TaxID=323732 RepID=A0AAD9UQ53_9APIC|nr:bifunctional RNA recognition motif domain/Class II Aminoacyl-tRNA synthetase-Biotinyl protein ligase (BPL) and lipoyl protein ligase (LPL)/Nucleotide-binding alpha-beta plait domain superfamily/RNA-binding domain superfamily [Babesia duncani]
MDNQPAADITILDDELKRLQGMTDLQMAEEEPGTEGDDSVDRRSIYVGNVDYSTKPQDLQEFFKASGQINRITIMVDKWTGRSKGFAYIEFANENAVSNAVMLNESLFKDRIIRVIPKRKNIPGLGRSRGNGYKRPSRGRGFRACLASNHNAYFVVNAHSSDTRAVIMGISGKAKDFIRNPLDCNRLEISLYNRFTGGGTVVVDENSITSSIICPIHLAVNIGPDNISKWAFDTIYKTCGLFNDSFGHMDGDFVVGNGLDIFKVAGNAQALSQKALVHHSVFMWRQSPMINELLLKPSKAPPYRRNRNHDEFLKSINEALVQSLDTTIKFAQELCMRIGHNIPFIKRKVIIDVLENTETECDIREAGFANRIEISRDFISQVISTIPNPTTCKALP